MVRGKRRRTAPPGSSVGVDRDDPTPPKVLELDHAVCGGEQRVIFAPADVVPRVELGPPLTDQDVPGHDSLALVPFHAKTVGVGIPPVS